MITAEKRIGAIETRYKGYRFRSRLEARWAVFFDYLGMDWEYEKEGYDFGGVRYLPDFFIRIRPWCYDAERFPGAGKWFEIKPLGEPDQDAIDKAHFLCRLTQHTTIILCGDPGNFVAHCFHQNSNRSIRNDWDGFGKDDGLPFGYFPACLFHVFTDRPELTDKAIAAARGARFEHGENG